MEKIIIRAFGDKNWIGGIYYSRNIVFQLMQNKRLSDRLVVFTSFENRHLFDFAKEKICVITCKGRGKRENNLELLRYLIKHKGGYLYPGPRLEKIPNFIKRCFGIKPIMWIPDFQHNYFPEFFSEKQLINRTLEFEYKGNNRAPLILSSNDSMNDFRRFYSQTKRNVYVMPFVSYIEDIIYKIEQNEYGILEKFNLNGKKYACIMNQFWQHKNHKIVLEALKKYFTKNPHSEYIYVFTGRMSDERNQKYIEEIKSLFNDSILSGHICLLGFIAREEQIAIMKNAEYIIQPSLFEGWGTVVEDAKVLDKTIILSDLSVHREQKNEKCILFDPLNSDELEQILEQENEIDHQCDIRNGLKKMYNYAERYSKVFERVIEEY